MKTDIVVNDIALTYIDGIRTAHDKKTEFFYHIAFIAAINALYRADVIGIDRYTELAAFEESARASVADKLMA